MTPRTGVWRRAVQAVVALAGAAPLILRIPAPLQDWPSHLSRVHILAQMLHGPSPWSQYYDISTFFLPNIILDVGLLGLMHLGFGLNAASAVFLLFTYALFMAGFGALCAAYRAFDASKLPLGCILFYSVPLFWGFINYQFGTALSLCCLALWLWAGERVALKLIAAVGGAVAIFFCHLVAAGAFVVVLGCTDLVRLARDPSWRGLRRNTTSIPAALAVFALLLHSPTSGDRLLDLLYVDAGSVTGFAKWKAGLFVKALLGAGNLHDGVLLAALVIAIIAILAAARLRFAIIGAAAVLAAVLLCVASPWIAGHGALLDSRLAVLPLILLAAALRFDWRGDRARRLVVALLAAIVMVRSGIILDVWRHGDAVFSRFADESATLPSGSVVMTALALQPGKVPWNDRWTPPIAQIASLAAIDTVFVPTMFADPSQQPLVLKAAFRRYKEPLDFSSPTALAGGLADLRELCALVTPHPVYLLLLYPTALTNRAIAPNLIVWRQPKMQLIEFCRPPRHPTDS